MTFLVYSFQSVFALGLNILIQILSVRYIHCTGYFKSIILGFVTGFLFVLLISLSCMHPPYFQSTADFFSILIVDILTYSFLSYCYFAFINTSVTAIRIRLLQELDHASDGLSFEDLLINYNSKFIIQMRLVRLKHNHQINFDGKRYFVRLTFVSIMALVIEFMKFLVLGRKMRLSK